MAKNEPTPATETKTESVTLTVDQLRTLIGEAAHPVATQQNLDEMFEQHQRMMADARGKVKKAWFLAFVSPATKACGVAYVTVSKRHASGRVLSLPEYRFPEGADRSTANGGLCTLNEILGKDGRPTALFKQWKYTTFWREDLRTFVGGDASRLQTVGPARPTLADAIADLNEHASKPQSDVEPQGPAIVAREAIAP